MKILVTGATGFIGQHLVPYLLQRGHQVVALARDTQNAARYAWYPHVSFVMQDLHARDFEPSFTELGCPDALIHLAWPGLPNYQDLFHIEENLPFAYRFISALVKQGLKHVLVTGTCFEYGLQSGGLAENRPTNPANPYGLAKDALHKFLLSLQRHIPFGLQWARLFYMHGPGQSTNSLLAQLDRAIERSDKQFNMSGGEQLRDYLPVQVVALRLAALVSKPEHQGTFNICHGEPTSVRRLVETHIKIRQAYIALNLGHYPYPTYEPMAFWGNGDRYKSLIGQTDQQ